MCKRKGSEFLSNAMLSCTRGLEIKLLFSVSIKSCIAWTGHQQLQGIQRVLDSPDACVQTGTMGSMINTG